MRRSREPAVYILASHRNGTLYTGVTSDLPGRLWKHREEFHCGYTSKYGVKRLVWFEAHEMMESAIVREKRIKKWNRAWKVRLIEESNADWRALRVDFGFEMQPSMRLKTLGDGLPPSRE